MRENKIVVHIGIPKTGSTSLQRFLAFNRDILNCYGYDYPDLNHSFDKDVPNTARWTNGGDHHLKLNREYFYECYLNELDEVYKKRNVILSQEGLFRLEHEFLSLLKQRYVNLQLIVYLRRQDNQMLSMYAQCIKGAVNNPVIIERGHDVIQIADYKDFVLSSNSELRYLNILEILENIVGEGNLIVNTFEEAKAEGLYRNFIRCIGLECKGFFETDSINISISPVDTEAKRKLNLLLRSNAESVYKMINNEYRHIILKE